MKLRKLIVVGLLILALPLSTAGKCGTNADTGHSGGADGGFGFPAPHVTPPGNGAPHKTPNANAPKDLRQPEPPPADPGPYQDPKQAVFKLIATGPDQRSGSYVEFTIGGAPQRIDLPRPVKNNDGRFYTEWTKTISVIPGNTIGFSFYPNNPEHTWSMCTLYHDGKIEDYQIAPMYGCSVSFKA